MKCKVRSVLLPLILLLPYVLSSGYVPTAQPAPEHPAEPVLTQPLEIEGSFSQEADGVIYTVSHVGIYPAVVEGAPSPYLLAMEVNYSGVDWNYLSRDPSVVSFSADLSDPIEPSRTTYDSFTGAITYSSVSVNNAWGKDGNFSYGSWVFIIHEAFEPAAYYDIQLHGYEKPLAQAEVIEIPIQQ